MFRDYSRRRAPAPAWRQAVAPKRGAPAGIEFIDESGGCPGVRLRKRTTEDRYRVWLKRNSAVMSPSRRNALRGTRPRVKSDGCRESSPRRNHQDDQEATIGTAGQVCDCRNFSSTASCSPRKDRTGQSATSTNRLLGTTCTLTLEKLAIDTIYAIALLQQSAGRHASSRIPLLIAGADAAAYWQDASALCAGGARTAACRGQIAIGRSEIPSTGCTLHCSPVASLKIRSRLAFRLGAFA